MQAILQTLPSRPLCDKIEEARGAPQAPLALFIVLSRPGRIPGAQLWLSPGGINGVGEGDDLG